MQADIDLVTNVSTIETLTHRQDIYLIRAVDECEALNTHRGPRSGICALRTPGKSNALPVGEVDECRARHSQHVFLRSHHTARGPPAVPGRESGAAHHQRVEDACRRGLLDYLLKM